MTRPTSSPTPTPACAAFESLLPLLDTDALTADEVVATRDHVAGCVWCRAQREKYAKFEAALRLHYRPDPAVSTRPSLELEDIMSASEAEATPQGSEQDILEISSMTPPMRRQNHQPNRRRSGGPRLLAEIAAVLVVGLLATTLLVSRFGIPGAITILQPPLKSPAGAVVFVHSVPWGKLQLNGQTISIASNGAYPLYLAHGENIVVYHAPPLPVLRCTISAPAAAHDTCPLITVQDGMISSNGTPASAFAGRMIDLQALPDRLAEIQRGALVAATQQALDALTFTTQIQPGDHFLTPEWHMPAASQAFPMILSYHIAAENIGAGLDSCAPFCDSPENHWSIAPTMQLDYTDQYGKPQTVQLGTTSNTPMDVDVEWRGAWQVTLPEGAMAASLCNVIVDALQFSLAQQNTGLGFSCGGQPATHEGGMLLAITFSKNGSNNLNETANVLYRGGAFLALDSNARYVFPTLPNPSAHELAIARQIGYKG